MNLEELTKYYGDKAKHHRRRANMWLGVIFVSCIIFILTMLSI